jgi:GNAT superfamily N-acetyltransferase
MAGKTKADELQLVLRRRARKSDSDRLERGLIAYNEKRAPHPMRYEHFTITVHNKKGRLVGGLDGRMYWGWLFVDKLWLEGRIRRAGVGSRLLAAGEAHARDYGCHGVWLDTFQARPFYEKQGYRLFGQLDDYPPELGKLAADAPSEPRALIDHGAVELDQRRAGPDLGVGIGTRSDAAAADQRQVRTP